ncbi:hypothetical protein O4328_43235 [Rhodococcus opacus]|uniref:Uncharacterized protein n=1 Tax=Rhodococcus opacus TaxID=37919 RepID=A0AAX3YSY7_RHOOP|nr:hypothetical protein [Rhodococcus opacus]MCZ4590358.1 hypothetical protein [Rhodococcus opacus]WLF51616.1 hypothetical protein Q5707_39555 [Rhodococcus opacus]WLF52587.1 hypothetical protein Q5707_45440 [Rhodococcus opacus]
MQSIATEQGNPASGYSRHPPGKTFLLQERQSYRIHARTGHPVLGRHHTVHEARTVGTATMRLRTSSHLIRSCCAVGIFTGIARIARAATRAALIPKLSVPRHPFDCGTRTLVTGTGDDSAPFTCGDANVHNPVAEEVVPLPSISDPH